MSIKKKLNRGLMALLDMSPATRNAADAIEAALKRQTRGVALIRLKIGQVVIANRGHDGIALDQIAAYLGIKPQVLYDAEQFAKAFTTEELDLMLNSMPTNVAFHACMEAAKVKGSPRRLLVEMAANKWSLSFLKFQIDERGLRRAVQRGRERKPSRPKNPLVGAQQIALIMHFVQGHAEIWEDAVFAPVEQMRADMVDGIYIAKLQTARDELKAAQEMLAGVADRLDGVIEGVKARRDDEKLDITN